GRTRHDDVGFAVTVEVSDSQAESSPGGHHRRAERAVTVAQESRETQRRSLGGQDVDITVAIGVRKREIRNPAEVEPEIDLVAKAAVGAAEAQSDPDARAGDEVISAVAVQVGG